MGKVLSDSDFEANPTPLVNGAKGKAANPGGIT